MPPIIKLIQAIARLTQAGAIKTVEDAFRLAKRELGPRFGEFKENIKDAFNDGKKKLTIDKRTKNMSATERQFNKDVEEAGGMEEFLNKNPIDEEAGIKSLDVEDAGEGFIDFVRKTDPEGAAKMQKIEDEINKAIEEADKRVLKKEANKPGETREQFKKRMMEEYGFTSEKFDEIMGTPVDEKSIKVDELSDDDPMGDLENILKGGPPREPTAKEMTERALEQIAMKKKQAESVGSMSQEAMIRSALREFLSRRLKDGKLTIPDAGDRDAIERFTQGADPIDVFRKAYGEDAIKGVSEIQDEFGDQLQSAGSFNELGDIFEKLFYRESGGGILYNTTPKPVEDYGFDPGLMSLEEAENMLRKDLKEKQMLEDFDPTDREPNAAGGLAGILKL